MLYLLGNRVDRQGTVTVCDTSEGIAMVHPERERRVVLPVVRDVTFALSNSDRPESIAGKRQTETLGCYRVDRGADQPPAILAHPDNILWSNRIGSDCKIRLTLAVIEIIEKDELSVPQRCKRLINHGPTSTLTLSESSTPSFLRRAIGAITSIMSSG